MASSAQPGQRVLHFAAVEEGGAAAQVVGNAQQLQRLFQRARLVVAAEQDRELAPRGSSLARCVQELDLAGDALGLVRVVAAFPDADALAVAVLAPQLLRVLVRIVARSARWRSAGRGRCSGSSARA